MLPGLHRPPRSGRSPGGRAWQATPVFLPGESHGQSSLVGYCLSVRFQRVRHDWNNLACMQAPCCLYLRLPRPMCTFPEPHWSSGCFWNMPKPSHTSWFLVQIKGVCYQGVTKTKSCDWSYFPHEHCILLYFWCFLSWHLYFLFNFFLKLISFGLAHTDSPTRERTHDP